MFLCFSQMNANSSRDVGCAARLPRLRLCPHPRSPLTCMRCVYKVSRATWCVSIISGCFLLTLICSLFQIYLHNSQYPPLLQDHSRTLAIPYKELRHHRSPSESIGNNYSPRGQNLKIQHLQRRHHSLRCPPVARILTEHLINTQPCLNTHIHTHFHCVSS